MIVMHSSLIYLIPLMCCKILITAKENKKIIRTLKKGEEELLLSEMTKEKISSYEGIF